MSNIINVGVVKETLPTLNNPATSSDILEGKEAIGSDKKVITGSYVPPTTPTPKSITYTAHYPGSEGTIPALKLDFGSSSYERSVTASIGQSIYVDSGLAFRPLEIRTTINY